MTKLCAWVVNAALVVCFSCGPAAPSDEPVGVVEDENTELVPDAASNSDLAACAVPSGVGAPFKLRAVAANVSSGNNQSYDLGHGTRILTGLKPDVVMIQEFKIGTNSAADVQNLSDSILGVAAGKASVQRGKSGAIPNGVISRWPIVAGGDWKDSSVSDRQFTWAKIDLPGPRDLWVVSLHLLTKSSTSRLTEARELVKHLDANVPAGDFVLLGGDLNTNSRTEAALSTLGARVVTTGPFPADQNADGDTNASRAKPYDWVTASPCLNASKTSSKVGTSTFTDGLVFDSRSYSPLSDVPGVIASDSGAVAMQHMAVVKDFSIQP